MRTYFYTGLFVLVLGRTAAAVSVSTVPNHEGQESFKIVTATATYYYHKQGAGFASMEDRNGNDWLGYHPTGGSSGSYRGIPNMGLREFGHPGYTGATSVLLRSGPDKVVIKSTKGGWHVEWTIYETCAAMIVKSVPKKYWYLYEGTPGGSFSTSDTWGTSDGRKGNCGQRLSGDIGKDANGLEWIYFSDSSINRSIFLAHWPDDSLTDLYYAMSPMTVFGFGRSGTTSYLSAVPNYLVIGLTDSRDHATMAGAIKAAYDTATGGGTPPPPPPPPPKYGDANQDGSVSMADLNTLVDWLLGRTATPSAGSPAFINADVNKDNTITMADLNLLVDFLLGRITVFR